MSEPRVGRSRGWQLELELELELDRGTGLGGGWRRRPDPMSYHPITGGPPFWYWALA